jgi:spore coat polysaccharide biosynthesis protein SpsF (cytidylyltransferase family)/aryl-alcohol dehydrogenase-like predicted oxidoreductase
MTMGGSRMSPRICVVIQSRLASSRLPGKALLPLGGVPSVLLCARRAANTGLTVIIATSTEVADDLIVRSIMDSGISFVRGSHDDVLQRFIIAISDLCDNDIIVRLTADNVFPDGEFIEMIVSRFIDNNLDYLGTLSPLDKLPYGLSAEVFLAGTLRMADREATSPIDREHVTPWIKRHFSPAIFEVRDAPIGWSRLRCTLDSFDDYLRLNQVFSLVSNPVSISWRELIGRLEKISPELEMRTPFKIIPDGSVHSELVIGTAQLGMTYGIANRDGMPSEEKAKQLLELAIESGVTAFDTASAYGESEARIGRLLTPGYKERCKIITKLDSLVDVPNNAPVSWVSKAVEASILQSCLALKREAIDTLLLHRWEHHDLWGGAVWERLKEFKEQGVIRSLGVSVTNPDEAIAALGDPFIMHIQMPINILDWRWRGAEFHSAVFSRPDVVYHARSVLLQGLLAVQPDRWPNIDGVNPQYLIDALDRVARQFDRHGRIDLCIAYVRALPWVTSLVIGMETVDQLLTNLQFFQTKSLTAEQCLEVENSIPMLPESLLNPANWKTS